MKKFNHALLPLCVFCTILFVPGCTGEKIAVENHVWEFSLVQDGQTGEVTACAPAYADLYENAAVLNLSCEADGKTFRLRNEDTGEAWTLNYAFSDRKPNSVFYTLHLDESETNGVASVGITEYANGDSEYTLILTIDGRSLTFREKIG